MDEPKLTHVVIDKRDASRRVELIGRTSQYANPYGLLIYLLTSLNRPKRRHMVISEFIQACLDEDTLLDEDGMLSHFIYLCHLYLTNRRIRTLRSTKNSYVSCAQAFIRIHARTVLCSYNNKYIARSH